MNVKWVNSGPHRMCARSCAVGDPPDDKPTYAEEAAAVAKLRRQMGYSVAEIRALEQMESLDRDRMARYCGYPMERDDEYV